MADYSTLKVPDLKKKLADRGLVQSGNKADLIARLEEDDKKAGGAAGKFYVCDSSNAPMMTGTYHQQLERTKSIGTKMTPKLQPHPPQ
jgi:hypothetical protein